MPDIDVAWRVNAERLTLLGWSRAILLQLAHPLVAAGVYDHSAFRSGMFTTAARLHHTIRAMLSLTFGSTADRDRTLDRIRSIHRIVNGTLPEAVGPFPAGTRYSAEDPELLCWVHATLLDSVPRIYEHLVAPLTQSERDTYCREAEWVLCALGAQTMAAPRSWDALQAYMAQTVAGGRIVVGGAARALANAVLAPPFAPLVAPVASANRVFAVGLLPPSVRAQYGFAWSNADQRSLARWTGALHHARRWMPDTVALWPESRVCERTFRPA